jgi:hypothetical protein
LNGENQKQIVSAEEKPVKAFTTNNKPKITQQPPRVYTQQKSKCRPGGVVKSAMNFMIESLTNKCTVNSAKKLISTVFATFSVLVALL